MFFAGRTLFPISVLFPRANSNGTINNSPSLIYHQCILGYLVILTFSKKIFQ